MSFNPPFQKVLLYHPDGTPALGVVNDVDVAATKRLQVETAFKPGVVLQVSEGAATDDPTAEVKERLENGGSDDMSVDGTTPVEFTVDADPTDDIKLASLRLVMVANTIKIGDNDFGPLAGLTNGVKVEVRSNSVTTQIALAKLTTDFLDFHGPSVIPFDRSGSEDLMVVQHNFGGTKLKAGTGDFVKVTIQDDLSSSQVRAFFGSVAGVKV